MAAPMAAMAAGSWQGAQHPMEGGDRPLAGWWCCEGFGEVKVTSTRPPKADFHDGDQADAEGDVR